MLDDVPMFTPLGVEELAAASAVPPSKEKRVPIIPVPVDAPECDWKPCMARSGVCGLITMRPGS